LVLLFLIRIDKIPNFLGEIYLSSIINNYFFEKRWALAAITIGFLVGFFSAYLCIIWHLVIFGFNIMYIVSPLLAGLVETIIARRKYGKSTGAISALLTFILINIYGWFLPGTFVDPTKEPASLSLITLIAIGLTIQAAFPILVNYILFVVIVGIFVRLISLPSRIAGRAKKKEDQELVRGEEIIFEGLTEPLVSTPDLEGENISDYVGMVTGEAIAEEKESQGVLNKILKMVQPLELEDLNLIDAREQAVARMVENAESLGATTVVEILIDYVSVGGLQGSATIVTATGTAVILK
jgi:uncharacterized protein YbjQ (UPF0145 family)